MIIKLLREGLGRVIIFIDWLTRPKKMQRDAEHQAQVEEALRSMTLYQLYACPFCVKTRRSLHRLNLPMQIRNVQQGSPYRKELEQGGGRFQVPCLRLQDQGEDVWMYESSDIIHYLNSRFGENQGSID